jgi:hypothetical protein
VRAAPMGMQLARLFEDAVRSKKLEALRESPGGPLGSPGSSDSSARGAKWAALPTEGATLREGEAQRGRCVRYAISLGLSAERGANGLLRPVGGVTQSCESAADVAGVPSVQRRRAPRVRGERPWMTGGGGRKKLSLGDGARSRSMSVSCGTALTLAGGHKAPSPPSSGGSGSSRLSSLSRRRLRVPRSAI